MNTHKYDIDLLAAVESTNKKLLPLLRRAVERGESDPEILLADHAISRDGDGPAVYHCMARDQYVHGRNHHGAGSPSLAEARSVMFRGCNSYDRLPTLIDMAEHMDCAEWLSVLGEVWCVCDNITQFANALLSETPFAQLVKNPAAWRNCMMTVDEQVALEELPPRITIYRGCFEHNKEGLSWSMDREIAAEFPFLNRYRSRRKPFLITATVAQEQVLALKNDRDEAEIIAARPDIESITPLNVP